MSGDTRARDDLDSYIATLSEEERREIARAGSALDLALLLHQARTARGLTQQDAAARAGLRQQAVSRWERSQPNVQLDGVQRYLNALGYVAELVIRDAETGEVMGAVRSPCSPPGISAPSAEKAPSSETAV